MLPNWYTQYKEHIDNSITNYLNTYFEGDYTQWMEDMKDIIHYSISGWKRIRSILALEFYLQLTNKDIWDTHHDSDIIKYIIALECIHAYSLIHDDLPAMDNDEYRRWNMTVWKKYWYASAILAWDLLNTLSFEIISSMSEPDLSQNLTQIISWATGYKGMIWWQIEDLFFESYPDRLNPDILKELHNKKTGALISASVLWWVILSKETRNIKKYEAFGKSLWLTFQIKDDILDAEGTLEETWKSVWWEQKWFVHFLGLEASKKHLNWYTQKNLEYIEWIHSEKLEFLVHYIAERKR